MYTDVVPDPVLDLGSNIGEQSFSVKPSKDHRATPVSIRTTSPSRKEEESAPPQKLDCPEEGAAVVDALLLSRAPIPAGQPRR